MRAAGAISTPPDEQYLQERGTRAESTASRLRSLLTSNPALGESGLFGYSRMLASWWPQSSLTAIRTSSERRPNTNVLSCSKHRLRCSIAACAEEPRPTAHEDQDGHPLHRNALGWRCEPSAPAKQVRQPSLRPIARSAPLQYFRLEDALVLVVGNRQHKRAPMRRGRSATDILEPVPNETRGTRVSPRRNADSWRGRPLWWAATDPSFGVE